MYYATSYGIAVSFTAHHQPLPSGPIVTQPLDLRKVALQTYKKLAAIDEELVSINTKEPTRLFDQYSDYLTAVRSTLKFVIDIITDDAEHNRPFRILDQNFLTKHFRVIAWHGTGINQKPTIRLTKYVVYHTNGSYHATSEHTHALYATPTESLRTRYTRGELIQGALDTHTTSGTVTPLIWLSKESALQAMMQGTLIVTTPDKKHHIFRVHNHNAPVKNKISPRDYYWFFKKIKELPPGNHQFEHHLDVIPHVTLAGDLQNIGLGHLVLLHTQNTVTRQPEVRLGIIADTGGAFVNNVTQLDYFAGVFKNPAEFYNKTRHIPDYPETYILIKK